MVSYGGLRVTLPRTMPQEPSLIQIYENFSSYLNVRLQPLLQRGYSRVLDVFPADLYRFVPAPVSGGHVQKLRLERRDVSVIDVRPLLQPGNRALQALERRSVTRLKSNDKTVIHSLFTYLRPKVRQIRTRAVNCNRSKVSATCAVKN